MNKDTNITKKYRKEVCDNCGADCSMSPKDILECIDNQLNLVPIFGEVDSIHYSGCITDLTNFQETLIKEGTGGKPEGIVYKFEPVLLNKYKERLMFKCKFKDFSEFRLTSKLKQWRNKNE